MAAAVRRSGVIERIHASTAWLSRRRRASRGPITSSAGTVTLRSSDASRRKADAMASGRNLMPRIKVPRGSTGNATWS